MQIAAQITAKKVLWNFPLVFAPPIDIALNGLIHDVNWHYHTQHNDIQYNDTQHSDIQHNGK